LTELRASPIRGSLRGALVPALPESAPRYLAGVLALGAAYFGAAKLGQTLRYTASVSAIWPPVGLGIAALYLWGLRWWPGIFLGELVVNAQLVSDNPALPVGSVAAQWAGNMAEVVVGAWLLLRLVGPRSALDRVRDVRGVIAACIAATAISASVGTVAMLAGGVIALDAVPTFWRTWLLGDASGALVFVPLILTWVRAPAAAWHRLRTLEGALLVASLALLATVAVTSSAPVTYLVFPVLIWAAFRFGPAGATLCVAINAALTIGITADQLGVFFKQPIDERTLSTQLYILVAALTALLLSAVVSERERSVAALAEARRFESERVLEERRRIARELHDSVSQALFSSALHTRAAQRTLQNEDGKLAAKLRDTLEAVGELTRRAQQEMRAYIFEWSLDALADGLVPALERHASALAGDGAPLVEVSGPAGRLGLARLPEAELYAIGREALANAVKHADARRAAVVVAAGRRSVVLEVADDGCGFDPAFAAPGHFGLESMRSRAERMGGVLTITSSAGTGTLVRAEAPVES
jgi:signal transduction histidine kinase